VPLEVKPKSDTIVANTTAIKGVVQRISAQFAKNSAQFAKVQAQDLHALVQGRVRERAKLQRHGQDAAAQARAPVQQRLRAVRRAACSKRQATPNARATHNIGNSGDKDGEDLLHNSIGAKKRCSLEPIAQNDACRAGQVQTSAQTISCVDNTG